MSLFPDFSAAGAFPAQQEFAFNPWSSRWMTQRVQVSILGCAPQLEKFPGWRLCEELQSSAALPSAQLGAVRHADSCCCSRAAAKGTLVYKRGGVYKSFT